MNFLEELPTGHVLHPQGFTAFEVSPEQQVQQTDVIRQRVFDGLLNYLKARGIDPTWYDFMYSPDFYFNFDQRIIIPFYWKGDIVGYTGRLFEEAQKVKYVTEIPSLLLLLTV